MLWCLADAATNGHPQAFLAVWEKFKEQITLDDLRAKCEDGPSKGISVLWRLAISALQRRMLSLGEMFKELLTQHPSILNDVELNEKPNGKPSIAELIAQCEDKTWSQYILNLIHARNALFNAIESQEKKELLTKEDIETLSNLAQTAMNAGYVNALYDIGTLFLKKGDPHAACRAFQELPPHAKQFTNANAKAANILLGEALQEENNERHEHLKAAVWFTFGLTNKDERNYLLQKIAYCHLSQGNGKNLSATNPIDPALLECVEAFSSVESFFKLVELLYKKNEPTIDYQQSSKKEEVAKNLENNHPLLFSTQYSSSLAQPVALSIESDPRSKRKDEAPAQPNNGQRKKLRQASEGLNL